MNQKQMDAQDLRLSQLKAGLHSTQLTPGNVYTGLRGLGFSSTIAVRKVNSWCIFTNYRSDFTADELAELDV